MSYYPALRCASGVNLEIQPMTQKENRLLDALGRKAARGQFKADSPSEGNQKSKIEDQKCIRFTRPGGTRLRRSPASGR